MTHGSLFSGIGGFDLAAEWVGFTNVFQVEIDKFCQKILTKNFPDTEKFKDIYEFKADRYRGQIDIISGGFPCQPFSLAGKRQGKEDERALFPEMLRVIREIQPKWVVAENVFGLLNIDYGRYYEEICSSLETEGYEVGTFIIPASSVNAPHRRDRVWLIANNDKKLLRLGTSEKFQERYSCSIPQKIQRSWIKPAPNTHNTGTRTLENKDKRQKAGIHERANTRLECSGYCEVITDSDGKHSQEFRREYQLGCSGSKKSPGRRIYEPLWHRNWAEVTAELCGVDDGLPVGLDRVNRIKALGNAIVPQIAYYIFKAILNIE